MQCQRLLRFAKNRINRSEPHQVGFIHSGAEVILAYLRIIPLAGKSERIIDSFCKLRVRVLDEGSIGIGVFDIT